MSDLPFFRSILHTTDFTAGNDLAFVHALKIATAARGGARFTIIHADAADASSRLGPKGALACRQPWNGGECLSRAASARTCSTPSVSR